MDKVGVAILFLIALILSITVHEFGHAWVATRLGDPLPKAQGRLTLSPFQHIDLVGTIVFPLVMFATGVPLLGWGRPVSTNPSNYTRKMSRATGQMLVALAGPGMNFLAALLVSLLVVGGVRAGIMRPELAESVIRHLVVLNLTLLFFNLLPIPPLDGGAVLAWILPRSLQGVVEILQRWGFLILLGLMMTPLLGILMVPGAYVANVWLGLLGEAIGR